MKIHFWSLAAGRQVLYIPAIIESYKMKIWFSDEKGGDNGGEKLAR